MELNTARVFVKDIDAAKRFYGQTLGLRLKADGSEHGYCVFKSGGAELVVESVADDAPEDEKILVGRFTGLSFTVTDAAAKCKELQTLGCASPVSRKNSAGAASWLRSRIPRAMSYKLCS